MAKRYDENQARLHVLSSFGEDLARRAKSTCELSQESGAPLKIYEVPPIKGDPNFGRCLFLSEKTITSLEKPETLVPDEWRQLCELIWSEHPLVQLMAVRILTYLADVKDASWCRQIIDKVYLDEEIITAAEAALLK